MKRQTLIASILLFTASAAFAAGSHEEGYGHDDSDTYGHDNEHVSMIGEPAKYSPENRQIEVFLDDSMRFTFSPALETLKAGEAVTFIILNEGKLNHEFSISTAKEQIAHMKMMKEMPDMQHDDDSTVSLSPGEEGEINWVFNGDQEVVFSCNIPGHYEAGMHHEAMIVN